MSLYVEHTKAWVEKMVIGYNLCPFARHPFQNDKIRYSFSEAQTAEELIRKLIEELLHLAETSPEQDETTLIIHPFVLENFEDYNAFAGNLELILDGLGFAGVFQIAEFHPAYQFAGTKVNDVQNYTNRSPYQMLHILREDSIEKALENHPDPYSIPEKNIKTMEALGREKILEILRGITGNKDIQ